MTAEPFARLRRLPALEQLNPLAADGATDRDRHLGGLARAVKRAKDSLSLDEQEIINKHLTNTDYHSMTPANQLKVTAAVLRNRHPHLALGDPALIRCGPRDGHQDAAHLAKLVEAAGAVITETVSGKRDHDLEQVFGAGNIDKVKERYRNAAERMRKLAAEKRIVADRSGYHAEAGIGGLSTSVRIELTAATIDDPGLESVNTLIHEAVHAGNPGVDDHCYVDQPSFETLSEALKLVNAAHYEVVPRRIMKLPYNFDGAWLVPAGATVQIGGEQRSAPADARLEQARRAASERLRMAWTTAIQLHTVWVQTYLDRAMWSAANIAERFRNASCRLAESMPYWSAVERLTVHRRPGIDSAAATPSTAPVTQLDIALSEGVIRLLSNASGHAASQLKTNRTMAELLNNHATPAELTVVKDEKGVPVLTDLIVRVLRRGLIPEITGTEERDLRMINTLASGYAGWATIMSARSPDAFPEED